MKNIKKVLKSLKLKNGTRLLSLLVTLLAVSLTKNNVNLVKAEAETVDAILQQKRIPTLQDDFDDNKVVVVLNQKDSSFDKTVEIQDFGMLYRPQRQSRKGSLYIFIHRLIIACYGLSIGKSWPISFVTLLPRYVPLLVKNMLPRLLT